MKLLKTAAFTLSALGLITTASANENYWGVSATNIDATVYGLDASVMTIDGKFGTYFNENFSGELRAGFGITDDTVNGVDLELNHYFGAYVRGGIQAADAFYPYIVAGYSRGEAEVSIPGVTATDSESDFSYGIGADFEVSNSFDITVEYMNYLDKDGVELNGLTLGFTKSF